MLIIWFNALVLSCDLVLVILHKTDLVVALVQLVITVEVNEVAFVVVTISLLIQIFQVIKYICNYNNHTAVKCRRHYDHHSLAQPQTNFSSSFMAS